MSRPSTIAASGPFSAGTSSASTPCSRAASAIASTPGIGLTDPSSASSPAIATRGRRCHSSWPEARRRATASGRSSPGPALRRLAGARLAMIRCRGNSKPQLESAARTRSRASRTAASGRPTTLKAGRPLCTSTSTRTGRAEMPSRVKTGPRSTRSAFGCDICHRDAPSVVVPPGAGAVGPQAHAVRRATIGAAALAGGIGPCE